MKVRADVAEGLRAGLSNAEVARRTGVHPVKVADARRGLHLPDYLDMTERYTAPPSHRAHGTRAKYVVEKCRCRPCRLANRREENRRSRQQAYGRWQPYVDAGPVRDHVRALMAYGIGWKRVAKLSDVPTSVVAKLLYGVPSRGTEPSKRIRAYNAEKILAVQARPENLLTAVDGAGTRRRLQALIAAGWPQTQLARRLGMTQANFGTLLHAQDTDVRPATAHAVADLYDQLWASGSAAHGVHPQAASRARNQAHTHDWAPVGAWDEDRIDNPASLPNATGRCGTPEGYSDHHHYRIPMCQPCREAKAQQRRSSKNKAAAA